MRLLITLMMYCCFVAAGWAQPSNDECTNLIELGYAPYCSDPGQYTNVGATPSVISTLPADNIPTCMTSAPLRDVWFSFKAPDDGSLLDVQLSVLGNVGGNGTMRMPTVTVYRGDCTIDELSEFFCAAAPLNVNETSVNVLGLSPGATYYVRVTDYSATAGSNAGTFKLCIEPFVNEYVMGQTTSAASCTGILYDSGGSGGNYGNNQTLEFNICPQEFHQCILLTVENYDIENALGFGTGDFLRVYAGANASSGLEITQLSGMGGPLTIPINTPCATVLFDSDPTTTMPGFTITWECTTATCPDNPVVSCSDPVVVDLPFSSNNLSNCISGNTISSTPCADDSYLQGNDYVFSYTSQGDECIRVITSNTNTGAGLGVYLNCPTDPNAQCITSSGGEFVSDPVVNAAFLESPGTYYIVFGSFGQCSNFNISIDTVTCPVVLPSASTCDQSLNIAGCENTIPQIIALNPGDGDPNFITQANNGCINVPSAGFNFSFFYFQAQSDGKFGFIVESADQAEATDIDFNVWGPIPSVADICDFVTNNEPIRSSWEAWFGFEDDWTGLTDVNPEDGTAVTDDFDCGSPATPNAGGDGFVRRIDVQQGEIYVVMLDDYDGVIETGGIAIDFSGTTTGVLGGAGDEVTVTADTAVCAGQFIQLNATGGEAYFWADSDNLSCTQCPNPLAIITENSTFQVNIVTACATITRTVNVKLLDLDLGPDIVVCNGAEFQLNENADPNDGQYAWIGPPGLSCIDCPSPTVSGLATGIYTYQAVLITPQCTVYDTIVITVLNGTQPQYNIAKDTILCAGETINLGGAAIAGNTYFWSPIASPQDTIANPSVTPTQSTTYYISVNNGICPVPAVDSVVVQVFQAPVLNVIADQSICQGDTLQLGNTVIEDGVTYTWTPNVGVFEADNPNSLATPTAPTTIYTLTATNPGCEVNESVTISATQIDLMLSVGDTVLCKGNSLNINANVFPAGTNVSWNNISTLQIQPGGLSVIATPLEDVLYTATVQVPGCMRHQSFYVKVDSLPEDLAIVPQDTTICLGEIVVLKGAGTFYEPGSFPDMTFKWFPNQEQPSTDTLFSLVVMPDTTTEYVRVTTNGGCRDSAFAKVKVIIPPQIEVVPAISFICPGDTVHLNVLNAEDITMLMWMPATGLSCSDCTNPIAMPAATNTYQVGGVYQPDGPLGKKCPVSAFATIDVKPLPKYQFPTDRTLCFGESVPLNTINDGVSNYNWTSTDPTFTDLQNPTPTVTPSQNYSYTLTATNGCSIRDSLKLEVVKGELTLSNDTMLCKGQSTLLTASGNLPGIFSWNTGQNTQAILVEPEVSTTYTVQYTYAGGNCSLTDSVKVTVNGEVAELIFPTDNKLCPGETVNLNTGNTAGASYTWTATPATPGFPYTGANPPVLSPAVTTKFVVETNVNGMCPKKDSITVIVYSGVTLSASSDTLICPDEPLTLTANASVSGKYTWFPTGDTTAVISLNPPVEAPYTVTFTYGDGCTLTETVQVDIAPDFSIDILKEPNVDTISLGQEVRLEGLIPGTSLNGFSFNWLRDGITSIGTTPVLTVTPPDQDSVQYKLVVTSPNGCVREKLVTFHIIQPEVVIPNAFTPNGDQNNDAFGIVLLKGEVAIEELIIYNRWGQKVYTSTAPNATWDGRIDGKDAPMDVYVYSVQWRKGDGSLQPPVVGEVTLIR